MPQTKLKEKANEIKSKVVSMTAKGKGGHVGTSLSEVDILTALFFHTMNFSDYKSPERDRFVLSKGHGSEGRRQKEFFQNQNLTITFSTIHTLRFIQRAMCPELKLIQEHWVTASRLRSEWHWGLKNRTKNGALS